MPVYQYRHNIPSIAPNCYIAPTAAIIGQVTMESGANIWFGAVLRGDNEHIHIGQNTNIQENSVLHTDMGAPLNIGSCVTIGHSVTLHGCQIGNNSLIGMGATILNHAQIGANCIVGANSLITEGKQFPAGSLIVGSPAKVIRILTEAEIDQLPINAHNYTRRGQDYQKELLEITANQDHSNR